MPESRTAVPTPFVLICLAVCLEVFAAEPKVWLSTAGVEPHTQAIIETALTLRGCEKLNPIAAGYTIFTTSEDTLRHPVLIVTQDIHFGARSLLLVEMVDCFSGATCSLSMCDGKAKQSEELSRQVAERLFPQTAQATSAGSGLVLTVVGDTPDDPQKLELLVHLRQAIISDSRLRLVNRKISRQVLEIQDIIRNRKTSLPVEGMDQMLGVDTQLIVRDSSKGLMVRIIDSVSAESKGELFLTSIVDAGNIIRRVISSGRHN